MENISCITVCKNNKDGLIETAQSALELQTPIYEMIIVDGDSQDGTKEELFILQKKFEQKGILFKQVSEVDKGIFDAMNKGIDMATGEWLIFMNSGDKFATKDILEKMFVPPIPKDIGVIYGDSISAWSDGTTAYRKGMSDGRIHIKHRSPSIHQAIFFRRSEMINHKYSLSYQFYSDRAWMIEFYQRGGESRYLPYPVCIFDKGGISSQSLYVTFCDCKKMLKDHGMGDPMPILIVKKALLLFIDFWDKFLPWKIGRKLFP